MHYPAEYVLVTEHGAAYTQTFILFPSPNKQVPAVRFYVGIILLITQKYPGEVQVPEF